MFRWRFRSNVLFFRLPARFRLRGRRPLWLPLPREFGYTRRGITYPHLRSISGRIQVGLYRFHSPLLPASRLLSLPPATMMLRLAGFAYRVLFRQGRSSLRNRSSSVNSANPARIPGMTR